MRSTWPPSFSAYRIPQITSFGHCRFHRKKLAKLANRRYFQKMLFPFEIAFHFIQDLKDPYPRSSAIATSFTFVPVGPVMIRPSTACRAW